jgi:hypothetical protein
VIETVLDGAAGHLTASQSFRARSDDDSGSDIVGNPTSMFEVNATANIPIKSTRLGLMRLKALTPDASMKPNHNC